jgi:hypothetical protein
VRHGHLPEREIMTGIGPVGVRCPRVRDRVGEGSQRIRFSSAILPPYARRSLISILYLKGISTGDFEEALVALLGKDAGGLSRPGWKTMRRPIAGYGRAGQKMNEEAADDVRHSSIAATRSPVPCRARSTLAASRYPCGSFGKPAPEAR